MQLLRFDKHKEAGFAPLTDFNLYAHSPFCEVVGDELALVDRDFMLVFIKNASFSLVMLQSFMPGTNFYINALGEYLGEYIPSIYRQAPFLAVEIGDELKVGIDETSPLFKAYATGQARAIFEKDGKLGELFNEKVKLLDARHKDQKKQAKILQRFEELGLFTPFELSFLTAPGKVTNINGLFRLDEEKLLSLDANTLKELLLMGALELFYHHKKSLGNKAKLQEFYYKQNDLKDVGTTYDSLFTR